MCQGSERTSQEERGTHLDYIPLSATWLIPPASPLSHALNQGRTWSDLAGESYSLFPGQPG
jgi:hypothetical protein